MRGGAYLEILADSDIERIHRGALRILADVGVKVSEPRARKLLLDAGCTEQGPMLRLPASLVEEAVALAPSGFSLYGRNPGHRVDMEGQKVHFQPMIGRLNILDGRTGTVRRTNLEDVGKLVRVADALENYSILHSGAIMPEIEGVPSALSHVIGYLASARNSTKVIKGTCRGAVRARDMIRMASIIAGGEAELTARPNIYTTANVISPLEHSDEMLSGMMEYCKMGLPVDITSEPQSGATSPVNLAATLTQETAEILSGVVIAQLVRPGTPVFLGTCAAAMDMRSAAIALGGVEAALMNVAHAQIARFYGIPSRGTGSNTESKLFDGQAGYEKMLTLVLPAMAGINMIFYPGTMDHARAISLESLVIDNEMCGMVGRALKGIEVTDETLALELISSVGPGGHYLGKRQTLRDLRKEHYLPRLSDRASREKWTEAGARDVFERAVEEVDRILRDHHPEPLDEALDGELQDYVAFVEKRELETA